MDDKYPFLDKILALLAERETNKKWLSGEIDRSARWIETIESIELVPLGIIMKISAALEFDFIADFNRWSKNGQTEAFLVREPIALYGKAETVALTITVHAPIENASKVLATIKKETEKQGAKIS